MKKLFYILPLLLVALVACDPMDDVYDEVDVANADAKADEQYFAARTLLDTEYTLTDEDYALSKNESVAKYKNFSSSATATDNLAQILNDKMVYGEAGQDYKVSYTYYQGRLSYLKDYVTYLEEVVALEKYELTKGDYDSMGTGKNEPGKYDNFSNSATPADYLPAFLAIKYPSATSGDVVVVTYKYYDGGVSEITANWGFDGTTWAENASAGPTAPTLPDDVTAYELTADDYDSMGTPGKYDNFSSSAKPEDYIPTFLNVKFPYAKDGDKYLVVYKYYDSGVKTQANEYTMTDGVWTPYSSKVTQTATMSYKVDEKTWAFVPPIKFEKTTDTADYEYTLTKADYELVGNGKFRNFDIRSGKDEEDESVIIEKLTTILKSQSGVEIVEGKIYAVTYAYYDGAPGTATINLKAVSDE